MAENAADYSLMNNARGMLWLPTTRAEKYAAKQAVDTFVVRFGDVLSAALVLFGTSLAWSERGFAVVNIGLVLAWSGVAFWLCRAYDRRARDEASGEAVTSPSSAPSGGAPPAP
jgi:AAA family ATP:ADP antiporter